MEKEKAVRKRFSTFGKIIVAMAVLAIAGIGVCVAGYVAFGTMMVRVAIVVDVGAAMVVGLNRIREKKGEAR